ncbi:MAG: Ig-like domain-containing protein [Gemmatimonadota bacterium]
MKVQNRRVMLSTLLAAVATLSACDNADAPTVNNAAFSASEAFAARAASTPATLSVAETASLVSNSKFVQNSISEGRTLVWTSSNATVVSVDADGNATGLRTGSSDITATYRNRSDVIQVTVVSQSQAVTSLTLSASRTSLTVGQTATLTVVARNAGGAIVPNPTIAFSSSATAVAIVSQAGTVSALANGSAVITAKSGSVSATESITVSGGSAPPPAPPPSGGVVAPPQRPQILNPVYPVVTGTSWVVQPGDNLQTFLNKASRGDEIVLPAGATFTGNFVLPAKPGSAANGWILIRTNKMLPPAGTRVTPAHASLMPRIVTPAVAPALATAGSASGWWISGVEITITPTLTSINYGLVSLGDGGSKQSTLSYVASDLVIERSYIHGTTTSNVSRCIGLNSARTAVMDSYIHECHLKGYDSQAIAGWNGPGPFKIVNNTLAGAGENVMFGGSDPRINGMIPSDIEIRRNYIYTPASWKGRWTKKNLIESKNSQRVLVEGNVLDGSWFDAQVGYAVVLKSANQSGGCTWCATRDWEFRNNIVRNAGAGFNLSGREGSNPYKVGELLTRVWLEQNIVENINVGIYTGDQKMVQLLQNMSELTMRNNSFYSSGRFSNVLAIGSKPAVTNMEMTKNAASYGSYGLFSSASGPGESALNNIVGTMAYGNQTFVGSQKSGYPNSVFVSSISAVANGIGANTSAVNAATAGVIIP